MMKTKLKQNQMTEQKLTHINTTAITKKRKKNPKELHHSKTPKYRKLWWGEITPKPNKKLKKCETRIPLN